MRIRSSKERTTQSGVSKKLQADKTCPKCGRTFNRGTHMRTHLKTHDAERSKVVCSVGSCRKKYSDVKAWAVHFHSNHQEQMKRFNHYKNKLGSDSVSNPINFADAELLTKLKVENECLKNQIRNLLKLRCANRLKKRSVKQIIQLRQMKQTK